jgi:serine/threonine protein phosphatase PrpC
MTSTGTDSPPRPLVPEEDFAGREFLGSRELQEDCHGVVPGPEFGGSASDLLILVADGMGGHSAGEVASSLAVQTFALAFMDSASVPGAEDSSCLWAALEKANARIAAARGASGTPANLMGTTLVALLLRDGLLRWISVGDSPLFLFRDGEIRRLNLIHSKAAELEAQVEAGLITSDAARSDPSRHALNSALIGERIYDVDDSPPLPSRPGDIFVAASDGIETLTHEELARTLGLNAPGDARQIANAIIQQVASREKPRQDNLTVVVLKIPGL